MEKCKKNNNPAFYLIPKYQRTSLGLGLPNFTSCINDLHPNRNFSTRKYPYIFVLFLTTCNFCVTDSQQESVTQKSDLYASLFRSKRQTTAVLRSPPQLACISSGSVDLHLRLSHCSLMSQSTISPSWRTTRWPRLWVWCPCSRAPPPCGLTSQVKSPYG